MKDQDIVEEVQFTVAKDAFKGPFPCCNGTTRKVTKTMVRKGLELQYDVWHCDRCSKDYLDSDQGKRLENFWIMERILDDKLITIERSMNYDGKTHFFRFPREWSKAWSKEAHVDIKVLTPEKFLVEVKA